VIPKENLEPHYRPMLLRRPGSLAMELTRSRASHVARPFRTTLSPCSTTLSHIFYVLALAVHVLALDSCAAVRQLKERARTNHVFIKLTQAC
jgi:hypothetical protein